MQRYLPIAVSLENRACLVVGGGKVALRKIEILLAHGADVTVIAPEAEKRIEDLARAGGLDFKRREYLSPEAESFGLVISAVDRAEVNEAVYRDCAAARVPINVVDNPALCDFIFPAVVRRDCLSIAISTDGQAPFLAGHLRRKLEAVFPEALWKKIASIAADFRRRTRERPTDACGTEAERKARRLERFLAFDWEGEIEQMSDQQIEEKLVELLGAQAPRTRGGRELVRD